MDSRTTTKIRKLITPKELKKIIVENETFILHLTSFNKSLPHFFLPLNLIEERKKHRGVDLDGYETWLQHINVDLYEMEMKDAVDVMLDFGYPDNYVFTNVLRSDGLLTTHYQHAMIIIHKGQIFHNTQDSCYCPEKVVEKLLEISENFVILPD